MEDVKARDVRQGGEATATGRSAAPTQDAAPGKQSEGGELVGERRAPQERAKSLGKRQGRETTTRRHLYARSGRNSPPPRHLFARSGMELASSLARHARSPSNSKGGRILPSPLLLLQVLFILDNNSFPLFHRCSFNARAFPPIARWMPTVYGVLIYE
jgi:hypothetical protein